ncbi:MAG: hypothetical protein GY824_09615, partial [Delftia sp.]|nr:hypothetical protein [Delftia sp.]
EDEFTGQEKVRITNRTLLDTWPQLRAWLDEEREFLLWQRRLRLAVEGWEQANRRSRTLLRQAGLTEAERWLKARPEALLPAERAYIRHAVTRRKRAQRSRWAIGLAAIALALWGIAIVIVRQNMVIRSMAARRDLLLTAQAQTELARQAAETGRATAEARRQVAGQQRQVALARQLAVQSGLIVDSMERGLTQGMLLAVESLRRSPSLETEQILRRGLGRLPRPTVRLPHQDEVWETIFSPDGQWLATRSGPVAHIWAVAGGEEVAQLKHDAHLNDMTFSPDGRWLATASLDQTARIWETATGREAARLRHNNRVWSVVFSPDGQQLATRSDRAAHVWRLTPGPADSFMPDS